MASWLANEAVGLIVGALLRALFEYLNERRADQTERKTGRLEAERDQALRAERAQAEMAEEAARPLETDEALRRLKDGTA